MIDVDDEDEDEDEEDAPEEGFVEHADISDTTAQHMYRTYRPKFPLNKEFVYFLILK